MSDWDHSVKDLTGQVKELQRVAGLSDIAAAVVLLAAHVSRVEDRIEELTPHVCDAAGQLENIAGVMYRVEKPEPAST